MSMVSERDSNQVSEKDKANGRSSTETEDRSLTMERENRHTDITQYTFPKRDNNTSTSTT